MSPSRIVGYRTFNTPTGTFFLGQTDEGEYRTGWLVEKRDKAQFAKAQLDRTFAPLLAERLQKFFEGKAVSFSIAPTPAGSPFFEKCWEACRSIPRGQTRTYGQLAEMAGSTRAASRAAGQSMRNNPLPVIVPCHRVIGSAGDLHGFAGSCDGTSEALMRKRTLLELEGWRSPDTKGEVSAPRRRQRAAATTAG